MSCATSPAAMLTSDEVALRLRAARRRVAYRALLGMAATGVLMLTYEKFVQRWAEGRSPAGTAVTELVRSLPAPTRLPVTLLLMAILMGTGYACCFLPLRWTERWLKQTVENGNPQTNPGEGNPPPDQP